MASPNNFPLHNFPLPCPNWPAPFKSPRSPCSNNQNSEKPQPLHAGGQRRPVRRFHRTIPAAAADVDEENMKLLMNLKEKVKVGEDEDHMAAENDDADDDLILLADLKWKNMVVEDDKGNDCNNNEQEAMEIDEVQLEKNNNNNDDQDAMEIEMLKKKVPRKQVSRRRNKKNTAWSSSSPAKKPELNQEDDNNGTNNNDDNKKKNNKKKDQFSRQRSNADFDIIKEGMKSNNKFGFSLTLTREEIEGDFFAMTGSKPPRKPKRRPRQLDRLIQVLFPGSELGLVSPGLYKVD